MTFPQTSGSLTTSSPASLAAGQAHPNFGLNPINSPTNHQFWEPSPWSWKDASPFIFIKVPSKANRSTVCSPLATTQHLSNMKPVGWTHSTTTPASCSAQATPLKMDSRSSAVTQTPPADRTGAGAPKSNCWITII